MKSVLNIGLILAVIVCRSVVAEEHGSVEFMRVPTQFIAALGEPTAKSGHNAQSWGLWEIDPGPRGVRLSQYDRLLRAGGVAPAKWVFNNNDWWLEEHGLIMESPVFSVTPGKYIVTGDRDVTTILTVNPPDESGNMQWELAHGASLYDVTHLACRSARYTPVSSDKSCSPASASQDDFPVTPGAAMPPVPGCLKQDYAVLFVIGIAKE